MRAPEPLEILLKRLSVDKSDNILSALKKMDQLGIKLLIVNDNGSFKSLLSIGDIQRAIVRGVKLQEKIGGILREKVTVCFEYQSEEDIRQSMIHHRAEFMPVLNEEKGISRIVFWNDIIQDRSIHEMSGIDQCFLRDNFFNTLNIFNYNFSLIIVKKWESLIAGNCFVSQQSDGYFTKFSCLGDNIKMPGMYKVSAHSDVNFFHNVFNIFFLGITCQSFFVNAYLKSLLVRIFIV